MSPVISMIPCVSRRLSPSFGPMTRPICCGGPAAPSVRSMAPASIRWASRLCSGRGGMIYHSFSKLPSILNSARVPGGRSSMSSASLRSTSHVPCSWAKSAAWGSDCEAGVECPRWYSYANFTSCSGDNSASLTGRLDPSSRTYPLRTWPSRRTWNDTSPSSDRPRAYWRSSNLATSHAPNPTRISPASSPPSAAGVPA